MYDGLKKRGLNLWFDQVNIEPGPWKPQIMKAIARSRYYLIALSDTALLKTGYDSGFLDEELNSAYQIAKEQPVKEFTIVPVLLENCDRGDHRLSSFQQYALYKGWEDHLDVLAVAIGGHKLLDRNARDDRTENEKLIAGLKSRAEAYHYAGDYELAIKLWDSVLILEGNSVKAWHNKGNALRRLYRYDEALGAYDKALSVQAHDLDYVDTLYNKGRTLHELEKYAEAIAYYGRALSIKPDDIEILNRKQKATERMSCH
jgi:tetratricopeptide (TPR) repeat protein